MTLMQYYHGVNMILMCLILRTHCHEKLTRIAKQVTKCQKMKNVELKLNYDN